MFLFYFTLHAWCSTVPYKKSFKEAICIQDSLLFYLYERSYKMNDFYHKHVFLIDNGRYKAKKIDSGDSIQQYVRDNSMVLK